MKFSINRTGIEIVPEGALDEAYLEEVLGLLRGGTMYDGGDTATVRRVNAIGLSCWGYAEIKRAASGQPAAGAPLAPSTPLAKEPGNG